jgi:hypothetical protein
MNNLVNNWIYGEITPKLGGRFDLPIYSQGCETLLNFRNMLQGGITRRPPLKHAGTAMYGRLIPFTLGSGESFIIELSSKKLRIWREQNLSFEPVTFAATGNDYLSTDYLSTDLWEIQYAQYYDRMYFAHKDYPQKILLYSVESFSFSTYKLETDSGELLGQTTGNYPSVVGICQSRLWFASTLLNPYTIWVSRTPYDGDTNHNLFTTYDVVETTTESIKDSSEWPYTTDDDGDEVIDFTDTSAFIEEITESSDVISAKCAMEIEFASGRNDTIKWICCMNNIFVGTDANEWQCSYDIDPTQQSASMKSSYGSMFVQPILLNSGIFYIQKGNRLRELTSAYYSDTSSSYITSNDLSYSADHLLSAGVKELMALKYPDPMVFCLLNDGTLAVLCYDKTYEMQGWSRWETDGEIISIATRETDDGQVMYAIVKRDGSYYMEYFDFGEEENFTDRYGEELSGDLQYQSLMIGNRFEYNSDSGNSIGKSKKASEVWVRCLDSGRLNAGVDEKYMQQTSKEVGSEDYRIPISGGARKELRIRIESVEGDPLTLLAMSYQVEVN